MWGLCLPNFVIGIFIIKLYTMTDIKSWLQSRTIWSILVTIAPLLSKLLGFDLGETMNDVLTIVGAGAAIYFRIAATQKLK